MSDETNTENLPEQQKLEDADRSWIESLRAARGPSKEHLEWRASAEEGKAWRDSVRAEEIAHREWVKEIIVKQHAEMMALLTDIRGWLEVAAPK